MHWTVRQVAGMLILPERRVKFYTENILHGLVKTKTGRGNARQYDARAVLAIAIIDSLAKAGITLERSTRILRDLRGLLDYLIKKEGGGIKKLCIVGGRVNVYIDLAKVYSEIKWNNVIESCHCQGIDPHTKVLRGHTRD